ncbi:PspA-associated protein PspAA [Kitasatospora sp. NPDC001159]
MIARILGEGQYEIGEEDLDRLNRWDEQLGSAIASGDEPAFDAALTALLDGVRRAGRPLPAERLVPSDVVLPEAGATLDEVRVLLSDEGLIPG